MDEVDQGHYLHLLRFCLLLLWSRDNVTLLNMWPVVLVRDSSSSQLDLACMTHTYRNCPHFAVSGARRSFQMNCPSSLHLGVMHGCHGSRRKSEDSKVRKKALFRRNSSASIIIQAQSFKRLCTFFLGEKLAKKKTFGPQVLKRLLETVCMQLMEMTQQTRIEAQCLGPRVQTLILACQESILQIYH